MPGEIVRLREGVDPDRIVRANAQLALHERAQDPQKIQQTTEAIKKVAFVPPPKAKS